MAVSGSIFAAMLTPFRDDGAIAVENLPALVDFILSKGVHGLYASGSTGECVLQSQEERAELLRGLADYARGKCTLIAHVGSASTAEAMALGRLAGQSAYDAVAAIPPFYYKYTFEELADYYKAIVDAAGLPLMVYNIPALTGTDIPTDKLLDLLADPRIAGVKYTAPNLFQFAELRKAAPDRQFFFGTDEMFIGAAAIGTDGGIGSTYNLIGDTYVGIERAVEVGDIAEARGLQRKANDLIAILLKTGVVPGLKHAMNRIGVTVGNCRRPFSPPSQEALGELDHWLDANGFEATPAIAA